MEFLGIGPLELLFILLIVVLVFNPKDLAGGAKTIGRTLNRLYKSENYRILQKTSQELRHLPQRLAREANLEELEAQIKKETSTVTATIQSAAETPFQAWTPPASPGTDNRIAPAEQTPKPAEPPGQDPPAA